MSIELAEELIAKGDNVFVSGEGGTGKSHLIKRIMNDTTVLCAPTGAAALLVGGATCHSTFKLPFGLPTQKDLDVCPQKVRSLFGKRSKVSRVIIDEISMVRRDALEIIDRRLKQAKGNNLPFGGIQLVIFGDLYQLMAILSYHEAKHYYERYSSIHAFTSECWNFKTVILKKNWRNVDPRQQKCLHSVRVGDRHQSLAVQRINEWSQPYNPTSEVMHLCAYKEDAAKINKSRFDQIDAPMWTYTAKLGGKQNNWEKDAPVDGVVFVKIGAKVVIRANADDFSYVNGSRGVVVGFDSEFVSVKLDNGVIVHVVKFIFEKYEYSNIGGMLTKDVVSTFKQMPISLGWAVTVHSSQGMTLDECALVTGKGLFAEGMAYVAVSRITNLRKLSLMKPLRLSDVKTSQEVKNFYANLQLEQDTNND